MIVTGRDVRGLLGAWKILNLGAGYSGVFVHFIKIHQSVHSRFLYLYICTLQSKYTKRKPLLETIGKKFIRLKHIQVNGGKTPMPILQWAEYKHSVRKMKWKRAKTSPLVNAGPISVVGKGTGRALQSKMNEQGQSLSDLP